ncbi:MAG TPA: hypothetical protein VFH85_07675 [Gammaproteobacteria bacterium]|nr:hypothetical protein [Gammaproteobacteria bacterium]
MNDSPMTEQDRRYAEGSSRFAFAHARHYMDAVASGDKENAAYHRREIVEIAEWLEAGLTRLARKPSTMTAPVHPCGILPPVGPRREVFQRVFAAGREAFPAVHGLTCIDADRAFFQVTGDRTFYSVALLDGEAAALGYMKV